MIDNEKSTCKTTKASDIKDREQLPDSFYTTIGGADDFFGPQMKEFLSRYEVDPESFTPREEILVWDRFHSATLFEQPGIADSSGIHKIAEQALRIADPHSNFNFCSEFGRRLAEYVYIIDHEAYFQPTDDYNKPIILYSKTKGGFYAQDPWEADLDGLIYAYDAQDMGDEGAVSALLSSVFNRPFFQSFLAYQFHYSEADFGKDFPMGLFVKLMLNKEPVEYDRLKNIMSSIDPDLRPGLTESFLATEFGDDFGDSLLNIAENVQKEQLEKILEIINKYRELSRKYASWYEARDPKFANDTALAINERLTDILSLLERVALSGKTTIDTAPHRNKEGYEYDGRFGVTFTSIDEIIESMEELEKSLQLITDIVPHTDTIVTRALKKDEERGFEIYRFHNKELGDVLLYVRPEGAGHYDPALEYGNFNGVEASISWMVNPTDPYHIALDKDTDAVSFRFDREGRLVSEDPSTEERNPIREKGLISQDVSSTVGPSWANPVKLGRMVAAGNIIRSEKLGVESELHHNADYFDQEKYGTATGFAALAHYVMAMADVRVQEFRASSHQNKAPIVGQVAHKAAA